MGARETDERHCPNCGRGVISWHVACPGCDQVPWDTPAGRRVLRRRRQWSKLVEEGPVAAIVILALVLTIIGILAKLRMRHW